jgi:biopolymer transport protein ExbD
MSRGHDLIACLLLAAAASATLLSSSANAAPTPSAAAPAAVVVYVSTDGSLIVNRQPITLDKLVANLRVLSKLNPDQPVILHGDQNSQSILGVLGLCKQANIWNVAFATAGG